MNMSNCVRAGVIGQPVCYGARRSAGRVARLSYIYGAVSFRPAGVDDWVPVDFNRPLTTGDHLFVEFAGDG